MTHRGAITFTFDDGYTEVFKTVPALLEKYNFKGVFAVALNHEKIEYTEKRPVTPWQKWIKLRQRGHEIAAHSLNHVNLTKPNAAELEKELKEPQEKLGATTLVYPGGAFSDKISNAAKKYYMAGRTVIHGFEKIPSQNPMQLRSYNWTRNNFSVAKANLLALWAYLTNSWLIETFHMVSDSDTELVHTVKSIDLDKHLHFVAKLPLYVRTIQETVGDYHYEKRRG